MQCFLTCRPFNKRIKSTVSSLDSCTCTIEEGRQCLKKMLQKRTEHIYNKKHLSQATITYSHNFRKKIKLRSSWDGPLAQSANSSMFSQQCIARFHTECQLKDTSKEIVEQKYWDEAFNIPSRPRQKPEPSVKIPDDSKKLMHTTRWTPPIP